MEQSTNPPNYYKLRRGEQKIHEEKKHDKHRTWLHCGIVRITHVLIKVDKVDDGGSMCYTCWEKGKWKWTLEDGTIKYS
jgi:hypothetical protein